MLQETNLDKALKMVLAGKPVLAAVKKTGDGSEHSGCEYRRKSGGKAGREAT